MEEESVTSSETPVVKIVKELVSNDGPIKVPVVKLFEESLSNENCSEYGPSFGGDVIVDSESLANQKPSQSSNKIFSSRELLEAQDKEVTRLTRALQVSKLEYSKLNDEVFLRKEKLENSEKLYDELELNNKKLQQQISEAEKRYNLHLNTIQEALQAEETCQKELTDMKESFDSVQTELQSAKSKMFEFEQELQLSAGEAHKLEELHMQSASIAELETKRALELKGLLEMAIASGKEVEDRMFTSQEELKCLYKKIAEKEKVEEALKLTTIELCTVQSKLEISNSQLVETGNRLAAKEIIVNELTQDLDMRKASDAQVKEEYLAVECLLSSTKKILQIKVSELKDIKLKLNEEVRAKELVEESLKNQESEVMMLKEEFKKFMSERETYEPALADLRSNNTQMKKLCSDLEAELQVSNNNFCKADSLMSQALANSTELEQRLRSLEELHFESDNAASSATQKIVELEEVLQAKNDAVEDAKFQTREVEARSVAAKHRISELEEHNCLLEVKCSDAERELNACLISVEEENKRMSEQKQRYESKITHLESELSSLSSRELELESEFKCATEKCAELKGKASLPHQLGLVLEVLIQSSHSKLEDSERKASQLELLLDTEKHKCQELERQINTLENKRWEAEENFMKHSNKVLELETEIKVLQPKCFKKITEEKLILGDALKKSTKKLGETENILDILQNELNLTQKTLEIVICDLKASGMRETEVMEKLKFAEEQIEKQGRALEKITTRSSELELMHSTVGKDRELKLQKEIANFSSTDSEAKSLQDKVQALEDQATIYKEQETEAAERSASLREECNQIALELASSESINEELNKKVSKAEDKAAQSFLENRILIQIITELKDKIYNEFQVLLEFTNAEKESTSQQLLAYMNTIKKLKETHTKATEFQVATETGISEAQTQLHDTLKKYTLRDTEATELNEKLAILKKQINLCQEQAREASAVSEAYKTELYQAMYKLKALENKSGQLEKENEELIAKNLKLSQELDVYGSRMSDLQTKSSATSSEKVEAVKQLHGSQIAFTELARQQIPGEKLQSQKLITKEKDLQDKKHENAKELQTVILRPKGQLEEKNLSEDALKNEIIEEYFPKDSLKKLEEIAKAEVGSKEENVGAIVNEMKDAVAVKSREVAVKSREIGSSASLVNKDKIMIEATSDETLYAETHTQTSGDSSEINFNLIMGVALVSAIIGAIFGKRY